MKGKLPQWIMDSTEWKIKWNLHHCRRTVFFRLRSMQTLYIILWKQRWKLIATEIIFRTNKCTCMYLLVVVCNIFIILKTRCEQIYLGDVYLLCTMYIGVCRVVNVYEQRNWNVKRTALCQEHIAVVYIFATCTIDGIVNGVKILYMCERWGKCTRS